MEKVAQSHAFAGWLNEHLKLEVICLASASMKFILMAFL
jgi:hypothetical protein